MNEASMRVESEKLTSELKQRLLDDNVETIERTMKRSIHGYAIVEVKRSKASYGHSQAFVVEHQ